MQEQRCVWLLRRQLAVGPVAITSLLLSAGLGRIQDDIDKVNDPNAV